MQWVTLPQQARSQKSLDRILDATEMILEKKAFSEITVAEIVKEAKSSIGVFYSRFVSKLSLLHHLDERFLAEAKLTAEKYLVESGKWRGNSLADLIKKMIAMFVAIHRQRRGMLRAIVLQSRLRSDTSFRSTEDQFAQLLSKTFRFLLNWRGEIRHPQPEKAVKIGFYMTFNTLRDKILFETSGPPDVISLSDQTLVVELSLAFASYLGVKEKKQSRRFI